jgi:hypothetical protein
MIDSMPLLVKIIEKDIDAAKWGFLVLEMGVLQVPQE